MVSKPAAETQPGAPVIRVIAQREEDDCACACLAMLTGETYEDVLRAIVQVDPDGGREGLTAGELIKVAKYLGYTVRRRRKFDLEVDQGILIVHYAEDKDRHILMLVEGGWLIDTDSQLWQADVYLADKKATPELLLVLEEDA